MTEMGYTQTEDGRRMYNGKIDNRTAAEAERDLLNGKKNAGYSSSKPGTSPRSSAAASSGGSAAGSRSGAAAGTGSRSTAAGSRRSTPGSAYSSGAARSGAVSSSGTSTVSSRSYGASGHGQWLWILMTAGVILAVIGGLAAAHLYDRSTKSANEQIIDNYMNSSADISEESQRSMTASAAENQKQEEGVILLDSPEGADEEIVVQGNEAAASAAVQNAEAASAAAQADAAAVSSDSQENAGSRQDVSANAVVILPNSQAGSADNDYLIADSDSRYLGEEDIVGCSQEEIQLIVNEIYARHGRVFTIEANCKYFSGKSWYQPCVGKTDEQIVQEFNSYEKANVEFLACYLN